MNLKVTETGSTASDGDDAKDKDAKSSGRKVTMNDLFADPDCDWDDEALQWEGQLRENGHLPTCNCNRCRFEGPDAEPKPHALAQAERTPGYRWPPSWNRLLMGRGALGAR